MKREMIITDIHPSHQAQRKAKKLAIELQGGSPWYGYIWLNGECYTVVEGARTFWIKRKK
ncbi:hypothetical protein LCGC14_2145790 [marine sediment metagenome]|uniref:Uncharacterized protein n=1 Tax=marine sediment metagenome TaxID=412755 RepID=A0A0F9EJA2_9ZZZZ